MVTFWREGKQTVRVVARGATIDEAVGEAATRLATHPALARLNDRARRQGRIKVDLVVGRAPLAATSALIRAIGLNPGLEGLGVTVGSAGEVVLTPDDLVREHLHGTARPISFIPDFVIGFDLDKADALLGKLATQELGLQKADYESASRVYWRLRTDSFVERPQGGQDGPPLPLYRGIPPRPELTAEGLRAAAIAGGHYLVAHLAENGRYIYQRNLTTGRGTDPKRRGPYSIPRHAGTTYFLAELYRITGDESFREPVERAFAHLGELIEAGGCTGTLPGGTPFACVVDLGEKAAALGSTALTVVALAEYHRATGDDRYDELARQLAEWILYMQRPDGSFAHVYDLGTRTKDESAHSFYYSGEAALALARMHVVTGDDRYREATERALDEQVGWYDFFLGGFFYGEDHWTCIAAEAAYPAIKKDTYRVFCDGYGAFLRAQQPSADDFPDQEDWAGSYTFTPFILPQNTPAGSRTEAMISAYLLGTYHGKPNQALRAQILRALHYTLGQQIRPESDIAVSPAAHGHGAIPGSPVDRSVRIDYVQHVCSAMIRSTELIESTTR